MPGYIQWHKQSHVKWVRQNSTCTGSLTKLDIHTWSEQTIRCTIIESQRSQRRRGRRIKERHLFPARLPKQSTFMRCSVIAAASKQTSPSAQRRSTNQRKTNRPFQLRKLDLQTAWQGIKPQIYSCLLGSIYIYIYIYICVLKENTHRTDIT